eukprot:TRINITY_DN54259_c0_g1_i1.p1 TRINITY_DN54259_c0_g1~~TRINITY_DN54259_c0_g1_i1.p1  ORF type:complete len:326 (+),score=101.17 TRINITY_DN54259_c0_g1_i1:180-1157(+)
MCIRDRYCTAPHHLVNLTEKTKGMAGECHFKISDNKCYEGCADAKFSMTGLTGDGTCPTEYSVTEKVEFVESCSDGVTNVKYCTKPLYVVNVTMRTKGEAAAAFWLGFAAGFAKEKTKSDSPAWAKFVPKPFEATKGEPAAPAWAKFIPQPTVAPMKKIQETKTKVSSYSKKYWSHVSGEDKAYWQKVSGVVGEKTMLYNIQDDECREALVPSKLVSEALKVVTVLKVGDCAGKGYTVADGSKTLDVPTMGSVTVRQFVKPSVETMNVNAECKPGDDNCPSSYCQNGFCHGCFDKCCLVDTDCTKKGFTYCQNDSTKTPPYFCHA